MSMNKRTEKAIKEWLKLPRVWRGGTVDDPPGTVVLYELPCGEPYADPVEVARFTLASVIKKRYPAKKKRKGAK
jgi:hypothetical protein